MYTVKFDTTEIGLTLPLSDGSYERTFNDEDEDEAEAFAIEEQKIAESKYKTTSQLNFELSDDDIAKHVVELFVYVDFPDEDGFLYGGFGELFYVE